MFNYAAECAGMGEAVPEERVGFEPGRQGLHLYLMETEYLGLKCVSQDRSNKVPLVGWLKVREFCSLIIQDATDPIQDVSRAGSSSRCSKFSF